MSSTAPRYTVVVPTIGRDGLRALLTALARAEGPPPEEIIVVDDRAAPDGQLRLPEAGPPVRVVRSGGGRGPAAARNAGWRAAGTEWIAFLDDDVMPAADWPAGLAGDLADLDDDVAGSQGWVRVPPPAGGRRPTDGERGTAGLANAAWITADMAYRRDVLAQTGGFDERFPRAYREDADLALRVMTEGWRLVRGSRTVIHPPHPAGFWSSVAAQRGNADDVLMRKIHGPHWRERAQAGAGRLPAHLAATGCALLGGGLAAGRFAGPRPPRTAAALFVAGWAALTAEFAVRRILPGPRTPAEIARMVVTSVLIPPAAVLHRVRGTLRHRHARPMHGVRAVLFDRDGTLIRDVPYNTDPAAVVPMPGARAALDRLRARGIKVGVVSNQSGVARGLIGHGDLRRVNERVQELLGPFDVWEICTHWPAAGCRCRKPRPGLIESAARRLGVDPDECVVVGDIGSDVEAGSAAHARPILVPTGRTREAEVQSAPKVADDLMTAVGLALRVPRSTMR